ncbi:phage tail protein [Loigolactobacillus coryniformis]|uniref:Uncharacterized protein n=1 Tax=Loigolactobacillus coryniformis subsp. torquens DSM 20004 = KCTC 3535 TaxID=1423822 RepID=A0A2D1KMQ9_9LACO|nr:phage tail protein [Loigolactobacillus coryniformis]ATO43332.1 hypothetical protein LC20004_05165 [Loigolactobacillus coryniformis subsp. torquens DSM 20004 = KCTC 3535]KRK85645.1 reticulocyte binding protein [Loigolactobacillus coryniformis subsp. torquens DSM 20004 = KCTC 3535]
MIRFYDVANTAHIAQATLKRATGVNGSKTVTGEIIAGNAVINGIGRGWSLVFDDEPYVITYTKVNDQTKSVEFDAIQKFFWDFAKSGFYQEWNGSHTFTAYLNALFENTGYEYILDVDVAAFEKENWGMKNRLTLFNDVISQAGVEFELIGKRVKITKAIGSDLSTIVRKGFNLSDMVSESSITDFVTYGKGFGAFNDSNDHSKGRMEVEYKSPLADTYGVLEADPVVDERYTIAGSLLAAVKAKVDDSVAISIDLKIYDLPEADFTYQVPQAGDWIMAIDEAIGFSRRIRIIKVDEEFDVNGQRINYTATCGDLPIAVQQELAQSGQVHKLEQLTKDVDAAAINANGKNTNYYGSSEPSQPREGDLWYKENGDDTELYVWADGRWKIVVSKNTNDIIDQKVDAATAEITGIRDQTNAAVSTANQAVAAAGFNADQITTIKSDMADAVTQASTAFNSANTALADAATALSTAQDAQSTGIQTAKIVDDLNGTVTELTKQTTVIDGQVRTVNTMAQKALDGLTLKSDITTVDTLRGTVNNLKGELDVQADKIAATVTASDVTGMLGNYATQSWSEGKISAAKNEITASVQNMTSDMATQTWTQGKLNLTADGLTSQISSVKTDLNNLNVGGRNYFLNSERFTIAPPGTANFDWRINITDDFWENPDRLKSNNVKISFTLSAQKALTAAFNSSFYFGASPWPVKAISYPAGTTVPKKYELVFNITDSLNTDNCFIRFQAKDTAAYPFILEHAKLEVGTLFTDWQPAPEDMATVTQFTSIEETIKGVQITANNAVTQSQYTQLAGQFTTTINGVKADLSGLQIGGVNLAPATDSDWVKVASDGWGTTNISSPIYEVKDGQTYTASFEIKNQTNDVQLEIFAKTAAGARNGRITAAYVIGAGSSRIVSYTFTAKLPDNISYVLPNLAFTQDLNTVGGYEYRRFKIERGTKQTDWSPAPEDQATVADVSSQITQLQSDINLRVKTGDLVSQINVSAGNVLIQSGKLYLDAASVVMGGTAFINAANIKSVNASTITTGTLDAATVNVIGLNASNITTGTISGANLSINLTTGEILFQKGTIKSTNGNLNIDIDSGNMTVTNAIGNGFRFEDGKLFLTSNTWVDSYQSKPDYGYISYEPNFLSNVQGMQIAGTDGIAVTAGDYDTFSFLFQHQPNSGAALALHDNTAFLNAREHVRIEGGGMYTETPLWTNQSRATIVVGGANGGTNQNRATDQYGNYYLQEPVKVGADLFMKGYNITLQGGQDNSTTNSYQKADLNLGNDGKGFISSTAIYNRTYSSGDHVVITNWGTLGRLTSARKYKVADQVSQAVIDKAKRVLNIQPAEWYDKAEVESIADTLTNGTTPMVDAKIEKHYGFIADDFDAAGLTEVVLYKGGEVDSLAYDRIPIYHNVILSDHEKRIAELETEVKQLKGEI